MPYLNGNNNKRNVKVYSNLFRNTVNENMNV